MAASPLSEDRRAENLAGSKLFGIHGHVSQGFEAVVHPEMRRPPFTPGGEVEQVGESISGAA